MKFFSFLFVSIMAFGSLLAQGTGDSIESNSRGFKINPRCSCLSFVSHCTGRPLNIVGSISYTCGNSTYDYPIVDGQVCFNDGALNHCSDDDVFICLEDENGYYEICDINDCEIVVYGTLDNNPTINGQPIGFYNGINSSASVTCQGPVVRALNTKESAFTYIGCPPASATVENLGFDFENEANECLKVSIFSEDGTLLGFFVDDPTISGSSGVELLNFFSGFEPGLYMLEFRIVCCDQFDEIQSNCGPGDFKTAWINLEEEFSYGILGTTGFFPVTSTFEPSEEANGAIYSVASGDFFAISLHSIQNSSGTDIEVSLISTLCDDDPNNDANLGTQTYGPTSSNIVVPYANFNSSDCSCFQIDITYDDGCETGITTDSWFFQSGPECTDGFDTPDNPIFRSVPLVNPNQEVRLIQNPIHNQIRFDIDMQSMDLMYNLEILDLQGRSVFSVLGLLDSSTLEIPFQKPAGTYFYTMQVGDTLYSGKIIKQ